jgi:Ca2+:H+ antiporter
MTVPPEPTGMAKGGVAGRLHWTVLLPVVALGLGILGEFVLHGPVPATLLLAGVPFLFAAVFAAVHHAETIAHRIGQPFGSVVLAVCVTLIEVSLIVSILLSSPEGGSAIARDTVFAAIMIALNGIVGICLLVGGVRFHQQGFQVQGATSALAVLGTLAVLGLILPNYTLAAPGPVYAPAQLIFVAVTSLALYGLFLYVQTISHRGDFLDDIAAASHAEPTRRDVVTSLWCLPVSLVAVVLLAEVMAHPVEQGISAAGFPAALVGVIIATIVLLPEGIAAIRAARANRLQTSLNIALGSALASLCLTIPTVAIISLLRGQTLILGLAPELIVLLVLSIFVATLTLATGRTTVLQGGIHLVIFAAFLTISAVP